MKVAILDDYQNVALEMADWSPVARRAEITVFNDHVADPGAVVERLLPFDVICVMRERTPLPRAVIEHLPRLKLIASTGSRNASIDMTAAEEHGIHVTATGYRSTPTIEMTWALIAWSQNMTPQIAEAAGAALVTKDELFRQADVVTIHLILSKRTRGLVGAADLALMKPTSWLINTSRGSIVDDGALVQALTARTIAGAALDVFDTEPLPVDHPFRSLENVLATPHIGYVAEDLYRTFYGDAAVSIAGWLNEIADSNRT
jgi:phosphoglycerate dehydrogenase-like enzyme